MSVEIEKKKRAANSPLSGNGKEFKDSPLNTPPPPPLLGKKNPDVLNPSSLDFPSTRSYSTVVAATAIPIADNTVLERGTVSQDTSRMDRSFFRTQKPQGAFRDEIVVEINTLNGSEFRGTITSKEAIRTIFIEIMGFERSSLGSLTIGYSKGRIVTFKLINQFDIDLLASIENFQFTRESKNHNGDLVTSILGCRIRGIRKSRGSTNDGQAPYQDEGFRWVKIEGAEYRLTEEEIAQWLEFWGTLASDITEDKVEDESDDSESAQTIGNGTYSVKMRLVRDLPQFLPMFGKRIRLYYRGIEKKCSNCFGPHARRVCNREKVTWIEYVDGLMNEYPDIPEEYFGKWATYVHELRAK